MNDETTKTVFPEPVEGYCFGAFLALRLPPTAIGVRSGNKNAEFRDSQFRRVGVTSTRGWGRR